MATRESLASRLRKPIVPGGQKKGFKAQPTDARVEDFLDDKLQTLADLSNVDALLVSVENQRVTLQQQLNDAQSKLEQAKRAHSEHTREVLRRIEAFEARQESLNARMRTLTTSNSSDAAALMLRKPFEKIRRIEVTLAYMNLLKDVEKKLDEARRQLPNDPKAALQNVTELKHLLMSLQHLQESAEGAAGHLILYIKRQIAILEKEIQEIMVKKLKDVVKAGIWSRDFTTSADYIGACRDLLDLQLPELAQSKEPVVLLPMAVLTDDLVRQFRFHFLGSRPTNERDSLETPIDWLIHLLDDERRDWLYYNVGPILFETFRGTLLAEKSIYIDPVNAFITALLPVMREKIDAVLSVASQEPAIMSKTVKSLQNFDKRLRREFNYDGGQPTDGWMGLTTEVLEVHFSQWLEYATAFYLKRFNEIMVDPNSGNFDFNYSVPQRSKPTTGVLRVIDLFVEVTKQYRGLQKVRQQLDFLINIQLYILDQYRGRLVEALSKHISMSTALGRTIQGVTQEQRNAFAGREGLSNLCKVYSNSEHIISLLRDSGDKQPFVEILAKLPRDAKITNSDLNEAQELLPVDVGSDQARSLFDEPIAQYEDLRRKTLDEHLINHLKSSLHDAMKPYMSTNHWAAMDIDIETDTDASLLSITPELEPFLRVIERDLSFLRPILAPAAFIIVWLEMQKAVQDLVYNGIVLRSSFSAWGALQFQRDLQAIMGKMDTFCLTGQSSATLLAKLVDASRLLNLPLLSGDSTMISSRVMSDLNNDLDTANNTLSQLQCFTISIQEARQVLNRRVFDHYDRD